MMFRCGEGVVSGILLGAGGAEEGADGRRDEGGVQKGELVVVSRRLLRLGFCGGDEMDGPQVDCKFDGL